MTGTPPGGRERAEDLLRDIAAKTAAPITLMELCGSHTMAISRFGLRARLPDDLRLVSGPGCPVCVTPASHVDQLMAMARLPGVIVATFGDMLRVPGSETSLEVERATGIEIRTVYSPMEALELARSKPDRRVVFFGIGFETTSPTVGATLIRALESKIDNFLVLPVFKVMPPAMEALLDDPDARIDGFVCPGHVSAIIGSAPYRPLAEKYKIPCVITGFEAIDILEGISMLLTQHSEKLARVEIQYGRAVPPEGNPVARQVMERVFQPCDAEWRGLGMIPGSGLKLSEEFAAFDAGRRLGIEALPAADLPAGCSCGEVLRGRLIPPECPLFGAGCDPTNPVGPCMVSMEGACAAYYRFEHGAQA